MSMSWPELAVAPSQRQAAQQPGQRGIQLWLGQRGRGGVV